MTKFIDEHRKMHGVEPICRVLPIAPSTYYARVATRHDPAKLSDRVRRDMVLKPEIKRVFKANYKVYGVRKVWHRKSTSSLRSGRGVHVQGLRGGMGHLNLALMPMIINLLVNNFINFLFSFF